MDDLSRRLGRLEGFLEAQGTQITDLAADVKTLVKAEARRGGADGAETVHEQRGHVTHGIVATIVQPIIAGLVGFVASLAAMRHGG
jgi:hypothetical protein